MAEGTVLGMPLAGDSALALLDDWWRWRPARA